LLGGLPDLWVGKGLQRRFARISAEITAGKDAGKNAAATLNGIRAQAKAYATEGRQARKADVQ